MWRLTTGPLISITVLFAEFAKRRDGRRVIEYLHCREEIKIVNVYLCFLTCLHFSIGCNHRGGVPGFSKGIHSPELQLFLLSIEAPESTPNSRSSGFLEEGAGITQTVERTLILIFLSLLTFFAKPHASLRAYRSCCKVS